MFVTVSYFHPSLIFLSKDEAYLTELHCLASKRYTRVEVTYSDEHFSLLQYWIYYDHKNFYITGPKRSGKIIG